MANRLLEPEPELVNTLFGLEPAPLTPVWRKRLLTLEGAKKFCTYCRSDVPVTNFGISNVAADKLHPHCNPCRNLQSRTRYKLGTKGKKRVTDLHRLKKYNLTEEEFNQMFKSQNGKCAICKNDLKPGKMTHIDHCHTSGKVREILCMKCNHVVGIIETMPSELAAYYDYITRHAARISRLAQLVGH